MEKLKEICSFPSLRRYSRTNYMQILISYFEAKQLTYQHRVRPVWPLTLLQTASARITLLNPLLNSHPFPDLPKRETLWSARVNHSSAVTKQRSDDLCELWLFGTGTRRRWTRWPWDRWKSTRETQWSPTLRYDCGHAHIAHIAHMHQLHRAVTHTPKPLLVLDSTLFITLCHFPELFSWMFAS